MMPEQCRAARAWLNWTQAELALSARVALSTVKDYEGGRRVPIANNLAAIRVALENFGISFVFDDEQKALGITYIRGKPSDLT